MTPSPTNVAQERPVHAAATTAQIISLTELDAANSEGATEPVLEAAANPLHQVMATVTVCVGSAVLSVGELVNARKEQVLRLDSAIHEPVDLMIAGKVVARGQLVAVDDHFAVRITQLPQALQV